MKLLIFLCVALVSVAHATDYILADGRVVNGAKLLGVEAEGIRVQGDTGLTFIKFADMTPEMQKRFNYDPAKVAAEKARLAAEEARKREAAAQEEARKKEAAQRDVAKPGEGKPGAKSEGR